MKDSEFNISIIDTLLSIGIERHKAGDLQNAKNHYEKVLKIDDSNFDALHLLGVIYSEQGLFETAELYLCRALKANPRHAGALYNLANLYQKYEHLDIAIDYYKKAISSNIYFAEAYNNCANTLVSKGLYEEAINYYLDSLKIKSNYSEAHFNVGKLFEKLGYKKKAIVHYDETLKLDPTNIEVLNHRASVLTSMGRLEDAINDYEKLIKLKPDHKYLYGGYVHTLMRLCRWTSINKYILKIKENTLNGQMAATPFPPLSLFDDPNFLKKSAELYCKINYPQKYNFATIPTNTFENKKIKIGYYSSDYHAHAVSYLIPQIFEEHDRDRFEVYAFSLGPDVDDATRNRIIAAVDHFIDLKNKSDADIVLISKEIKIDIAVDLTGHTNIPRTAIFAEGCAPVQVNYLGFPGTMGCESIHYIIADKIVIPKEQQINYTEKPVYMPDSFQVNDSKRLFPSKTVNRSEFGLPEKKIILTCFNNNYKLTPEVFDSWLRILKADESSVLWIYAENNMVERNLEKIFCDSEIESERLIFAKNVSYEHYLERFKLADLFLDTYPYNAGVTASDALWMGLPILTRAGNTFVSRMAASLLNALDLNELITYSQEEYEKKAIELIKNPALLKELKMRLISQRMTAKLFDGKAFTQNLEKAYEVMYQRWQANLPIDAIEI